jgi:hypothetical protein
MHHFNVGVLLPVKSCVHASTNSVTSASIVTNNELLVDTGGAVG